MAKKIDKTEERIVAVEEAFSKTEQFIEKNKADLCASIQQTILDILLSRLEKAALQTGIREIAIAGGVSANSGLRSRLDDLKHLLND